MCYVAMALQFIEIGGARQVAGSSLATSTFLAFSWQQL
jgi:hypothetical protein